jgi:hypothetical protein
MKDINEILKDKRIDQVLRKVNDDKAIQLKLMLNTQYNKQACVKFTKALGWEHLSVSFDDMLPDWNYMQEMKEMFWKDDEECFQLHPKKENYINNHNYCLHIWRSLEQPIPVPPTILVGFRPGKEQEDKKEFIRMQTELGNPITEQEADSIILMNKINKQFQEGKSIESIFKGLGLI